MKRLILSLIATTFVVLLLVAGNGAMERADAQEGAPFNPHGNYSSATNNCTLCHQFSAQSADPEAACQTCHPTIQTHRQQNCTTCHEPHAVTDNAALIRETIGGKPVHFDGASFEDGPDGICYTCHTTTTYHGSGATATHYENQDCTKCHPHPDGFRPNPQGCNVCHGDPPGTGAHDRHDDSDIKVGCTKCHPKVSSWTSSGHKNGRVDFADGKNLKKTRVCDKCHGNDSGIAEAKATWGDGGPINDCTGCHNTPEPGYLHGKAAPAVDAFWEINGHGVGADQDEDLDCQACHNPNAPHFESAYNPRLWIPANELCARCHNDPERGGTDVSAHGNEGHFISGRPPFVEQCATCHDPHGTGNLFAIQPVIKGNEVFFFSRTGDHSFDPPGVDNNNDLCATCHGNTRHNRNPSNWPGVQHFEGADCTLCHKHETDGDPTTADAFMPQGACISCHNRPMDNGDGIPPNGRRAIVEDFKKRTHHINGSLSDERCVVCHDQSTHGDGYIELRMPDGGTSLRFIYANQTDLTSFCQDCHDDDGSQQAIAPGGGYKDPFADGSNLLALPDTSTHSNKGFHGAIEGPFRETCNTCHAGHGTDNLAIIQPLINGNTIVFTSRTGKDSFDDPDKDDRNDLCATCHVGKTTLHPGGDHRPAGDLDLRGSDCVTCHLHDANNDISTPDAFMPSCNACHGSPPPPAGEGYGLNESLTPHQKHAGSDKGEYGMDCSTCHNRHDPNYSGHVTQPRTYQDVFFNGFNPGGSYNRQDRTCAGVGCHSNGDPSTGDLVLRTPKWDENSRLDCAGCHGDQFNLKTGSHAKHLLAVYRDRGADAIGCYECHADTALDDHNDVVAHLDKHVDFQKQVRMDLSDLWGIPGNGRFDPDDLTCANSLCHSDGAASREQAGTPAYTTPRWGNRASGACSTCHAVIPSELTTGAHALHFDTSDQGPGIVGCDSCHSGYASSNHVNGEVNFSDGKTLSKTAVCNDCHSPGGAVNGVAEARANWASNTAVSCEGCHDSQPSVVKGVAAPDMAGDGSSYGANVTGHGRSGITCAACHIKTPESIHFDGKTHSYDAEADNYQQTRWLSMDMNVPISADEFYQPTNYAMCYTCHREAKQVGLGPAYSNDLFTHSDPPPAGYPLMVDEVATGFRNERAEGFNFGNVPANIHWDHLDMNQMNWDSDGDGEKDSKPSCSTCHDPHGVDSVADGIVYPAMTAADIGIKHGQDDIGAYGEVTNTAYTARCSTCHPAAGIRYYRP